MPYRTKPAGYMQFSGLQSNDPRVEQYQLWIFDGTRDDAHPVDGGVFDINQNGEVIVPIHAKLPVAHPTAFAVTLEKPGGVVVSDPQVAVMWPNLMFEWHVRGETFNARGIGVAGSPILLIGFNENVGSP